MRRLISCDFFDFDSAERAMCAINHIDCDGIKMSLNRSRRHDGGAEANLIPVIPTVGAAVFPFPAVAAFSDIDDPQSRRAGRDDKCNLLVAFDNHRYSDKIINTLRRYGAVQLHEVRY